MTKDEALKLALDDLMIEYDMERTSFAKRVDEIFKQALAAPVQEPVAWVDLLKQAKEIIQSKPLWNRFIKGTPLGNDIAVCMASFAQEHTTPPAQRTWVGLTDEEIWSVLQFRGYNMETIEIAKAIEAKLKEKNT